MPRRPFLTSANVSSFRAAQIVGVRLTKDPATGRLRGFGHVQFKLPAHAEAALQLSGSLLKVCCGARRPAIPREAFFWSASFLYSHVIAPAPNCPGTRAACQNREVGVEIGIERPAGGGGPRPFGASPPSGGRGAGFAGGGRGGFGGGRGRGGASASAYGKPRLSISAEGGGWSGKKKTFDD